MAMYGNSMGKRANFNPQEFYNLSPTDRYTAEVFELVRTIIFSNTPEDALEQTVLLEAALCPMYTNMNPETADAKPETKGYEEWSNKFRAKIIAEGIDNPMAIYKEMYRKLLLVMSEAGLIGGDNISIVAMINDGDEKVNLNDIKPDDGI
jgi:hypothetical protein